MSFFNTLSFVEKKKEHDDIYTFSFKKPAGLKQRAGQHGLFIIPGLYRPHPFTLSSSPGEDNVTITTHVGTGSRYKRKLMSMDRRSSMILLGPILNFTYRPNVKKYVFLAQGIGITPFRSMLVHAKMASLNITTTLIHVDGGEHTFKSITEQYATSAYYPKSSDEFRKRVIEQAKDQLFYLSGSPKFIKATKRLLIEQGVAAQNIKADNFLGY